MPIWIRMLGYYDLSIVAEAFADLLAGGRVHLLYSGHSCLVVVTIARRSSNPNAFIESC